MHIPPDAVVSQIRQNLQDRYLQGFPIIKELVQNANDAGATCLHIGLARGFSQARHPLLNGPALFVANNGTFTEDNADAINSIGLSRKDDVASIGKFGLGLKSIFHVCEAFFYLACDDRSWAEIVNPWADHQDRDHFHQGWNGFEPVDQELVKNYLKPVLDAQRYFCLWAPLRRQDHCQKIHPIVGGYPGDRPPDFALLGDRLEIRLAELIPLLHSIDTIRGWSPDGDQSRPVFCIQGTGQRLRHPDRTRCEQPEMINGQTVIESGNSSIKLLFSGLETILSEPELDKLQKSDHWPKYTSMDRKTGASQTIPDRAIPHSAVCFIKRPAAVQQRGVLNISQAIFLPIDGVDNRIDAQPCLENMDVDLSLHGFFFVDPGRSRIDGWDEQISSDYPSDELSLRRKWNGLLAQRGTLPLVLPALDRFVQEARLLNKEIVGLTGALEDSRLFREYSEYICKKHQWVYCIAKQGDRWRLLPSEQTVLEVPAPPDSEPERPFEVFPGLTDFESVTPNNQPHLSASDLACWPADRLCKVMENIPVADVFRHRGKLDYLVEFVEQYVANNASSPAVSDMLYQVAQSALRQVDLDMLRRNGARVRRFLSFVPAEKRWAVRLDTKCPASDAVLSAIFALETGLLVLPDEFIDQEQPCASRLADEDAVKIFECLANPQPDWEQADGFLDLRMQIALQVIKATAGSRRVLERCGHARLFRGWSCTQKQDIALSFFELQTLKEQDTLFRFAPSGDRGLADRLQRALRGNQTVLIKGDLVDDLRFDLDPCDAQTCLRVLERRPDLAAVEERVDLVVELLQQMSLNRLEQSKPLRYLLHGRNDQFWNEEALLVRGGDETDLWGDIAESALRADGSEWRVIDPVLGDKMNRQHRAALGVQEIGRASVEMLLRQAGPEQIDRTFSDKECDMLLREIQDDDLLKRLPIHQQVGGERVRVGERTFLEGDFPLSKALQDRIVLIRRNPDSRSLAVQRRLMPSWTPVASIRMILDEPSPQDYWPEVMDALSRQRDQLGGSILERLQTANWLLTRSGEAISPQDVIYIRGLSDDIDRLTSVCGVFFSERALLPRIQAHTAFDCLVKIFPSPEVALDMLGEMMAQDEQYRVGSISLDGFEKDDLDDLLHVFQGDPDIMPACQVIHAVISRMEGVEDSQLVCVEALLPRLAQEIPAERMIIVLNFLSEKHAGSSRREKERFKRIHDQYLEAACAARDSIDSILPQIRLLNRRGQWKSPAELCFEEPEIIDDDVLDEGQGRILLSVVSPESDQSDNVWDSHPDSASHEKALNWEQEFLASAYRLESYFREWQEIAPELVGGFLCLLGDHPHVRGLAEKYLDMGNRHLKETRDLLGWKAPDQSLGIIKEGAFGESIHEYMQEQRYFVQITQERTRRTRPVWGETFEAHLKAESEIDHIFTGSRYSTFSAPRLSKDYRRVNMLPLREIPLADCSPARLSELLRESVMVIWTVIYRQDGTSIDQAWEKLEQSEQLDIPIVQNLLLDSALFYLKQLGVQACQEISQVLKAWDDARRRQEEERQTGTSSRKEAQGDMERARDSLRTLLQRDQGAQQIVLGALRRKIQSYQYTSKAVPFELFQNADDAVVELEGMCEEESLELGRTRFVIEQSEQSLSFLHWGRSINQFRYGAFDRGRERGFDRDLEKMLILSYSDKLIVAGPQSVTGKFGLGFKSVFLVTDYPLVLSGRLGFRVLGGIYPDRLSFEERRDLADCLDKHRIFRAEGQGTIIRLPIGESVQQDVLLDFVKLVHVLLVFSRRIKSCELVPGRSILWEEKPVLDAKGVYVGELGSLDGSPTGRALVLRSQERGAEGALLLQLNSRGIDRLAPDIPTIWVTTPTQTKLKLGIAINGSFAVDVGRAQLALPSENNDRLARAIGDELGESLCRLYQASSQDWDSFCHALNLAADVNPWEFWCSLWEILADSFSRADSSASIIQLLREMLWGDSRRRRGLARLLTEHPALPACLWSDQQDLTRLNQVRFTANGVLEKHFALVWEWPSFRQQVKAGEIVSGSRVKKVIDLLLPGEWGWRVLALRDAVEWELGGKYDIAPATAEQLGGLITRKFLNEIDEQERQDLGDLLNRICFQAYDQRYYPADELLLSQDDSGEDVEMDEHKRAVFASDRRVLSDVYHGRALLFFKACRPRLEANAEEMAEWARRATGNERRRGVLDYLLQGELGSKVAAELQCRIQGSWLEGLQYSALLHQFSLNERSILLGQLGLVSTPDVPFPPQIQIDIPQVLSGIYEWWHIEKDEWIRHYEEQTYPDNIRLRLSSHFDPKDEQDRKSWLALFMLGSFYTMGRPQPEQHRGFLRRCQDEGWLQVFADPDRNPDRWIDVLDQYIDEQKSDQLMFYQWMKQFVSIYQSARWLGDYVECFLSINRFTRRFSLDQITAPRISQHYQSGGPDAPSITRALGIGACFVTRELVRRGVLSSTLAYEHCYVPAGQVRRSLTELGCSVAGGIDDSHTIHKFLVKHLGEERATFDLSFDLPFLVISQEWGTIQAFMDDQGRHTGSGGKSSG